MNISTQLSHLDDRMAICIAVFQEGETHVSVYASALASESAFYADLAQKRAVELALTFHEKGAEAILGLTFSVKPLQAAPPRASFPTEKADAVEESMPVSFPSESDSSASLEPIQEIGEPDAAGESDVAPW